MKRTKFTLTSVEVSQVQNRAVKAERLAALHGVSRQTIYAALKANSTIQRQRRLWTPEDKERLKADLLQCIPNDPHHGIKALLKQYGFTGIAEAYNVLKVKSLTELRTGSKSLHKVLRTLKLKLHGSELYAPPRKRTTLWLNEDDLAALAADPVAFIRNNKSSISALYARKREAKA